MRITFTQSGGFTGIVKGCTVDTALLADAERREVESLVADSGFTASCEHVSPGARDRRHYAITIEHAAATLTVVCDDASLPDAARPLVAFLTARARPEGMQGREDP